MSSQTPIVHLGNIHAPLPEGDTLPGSAIQVSGDAGNSLSVGTDGGLLVAGGEGDIDMHRIVVLARGTKTITTTVAMPYNGSTAQTFTFSNWVRPDLADKCQYVMVAFSALPSTGSATLEEGDIFSVRVSMALGGQSVGGGSSVTPIVANYGTDVSTFAKVIPNWDFVMDAQQSRVLSFDGSGLIAPSLLSTAPPTISVRNYSSFPTVAKTVPSGIQFSCRYVIYGVIGDGSVLIPSQSN